MTSENPFKKLFQRPEPEIPSGEPEIPIPPTSDLSSPPSSPVSESSPPAQPSKRGRPATGKRSNTEWIGRTYYIRKQTDLDVETALLELKRQGVELDKSELVDNLLTEWLRSHQIEKP